LGHVAVVREIKYLKKTVIKEDRWEMWIRMGYEKGILKVQDRMMLIGALWLRTVSCDGLL
jgi:peptidyl-tRNA hydrolase